MTFETTAVVSFLVLLAVLVVLGLLAWRGRNNPPDYDPEDDEADRFDFLDEDTQEFDIVDAAFLDFRESIADILDRAPVRRDELVRNLKAATAEWERRKFDAITNNQFPQT